MLSQQKSAAPLLSCLLLIRRLAPGHLHPQIAARAAHKAVNDEQHHLAHARGAGPALAVPRRHILPDAAAFVDEADPGAHFGFLWCVYGGCGDYGLVWCGVVVG
ncbi:hypothetical protein P167DRAFT_534607 [Morchella conica CCBAS932]|uniref:Secreted protein n=1 Tax=Morchella conica CCBAS932 TaxID=1392247 RepID=A0A3N4KWZ9_9PEZI|nr:hypothetical protein P167DRAFT_534607 [Morchella conica CCBAS932]